MAYLDKDEGFLCWLGVPLLEDVLTGMSLEAVVRVVEENAREAPEEEPCGFIVPGWFGPFLLGPAIHFLRGRC